MSKTEALEMTGCRSRLSSSEVQAFALFIFFRISFSGVMLVSGLSTPLACLSLSQLWQGLLTTDGQQFSLTEAILLDALKL